VNGCAPALGLVEPPACPEVRDARPDEREEVVRFLREAQYGGGVLPSDRLVISVRDGCLAGAFRLAREEGVLVLRGMRVREDVRRAGIGLCLLGALADLDEVCFCVPHTHLDVFYGRAEFVRLPEAEMPAFLRDRARRYREQGLDVIVMRRDPRRDRRTPVELQSFEHVHALMPVTNDAHWSGFHEIRERVLFIERGEALAYDRCHPHDRAPGNHPMLLTCDGVPVGAVRVDLVPEHGVAIMRMVAVASGAQRRGHGRKMLALAEDFARERGCSTAAVFAAEDAVGFYARCGYMSETWDPDEQYGGGVQMTKALVR
jgi:N-acetylglutamate synthase-like GNAT family acetyltransferase